MADDLRAYAREAAARNGVDPGLFERQIDTESGFNPEAFNAGSGATGIAQIVRRWHPGVDPTDPLASLDYAAALMATYRQNFGSYRKALAAYNWGSGNVGGYTKSDGTRVPPWDGSRESLPAETRHYLDVILGDGWPEPASSGFPTTDEDGKEEAPPYNPDAPVDMQPDDWSCSVQSVQWLLRSLGRNPSDAWLEQQLVAPLGGGSVVTREYGLMDASGRQMAAWLQREYGDEMGLRFEARNGVSWGQVREIAGRQPVMLGGRTWNHWTGVRRATAAGLELANPAPNWKGVGSVLSEDEFAALGSWSLITAPLEAAVSEPDPRDARIAELEALVADKDRRLSEAVSLLGYARGDVAQALQAAVNSLRDLVPSS